MKRIILFTAFILFVSSCAFNGSYKRYQCTDGYLLQAKFNEKEVHWSLSNEHLIKDMVPLPYSEEGLYKMGDTSLQYFKSGKVIINLQKRKTICYIEK